jgi:hypothetical protein
MRPCLAPSALSSGWLMSVCQQSVGRRQRRGDTFSTCLMTRFGLVVPTLCTMQFQPLNAVAIAWR